MKGFSNCGEREGKGVHWDKKQGEVFVTYCKMNDDVS